jgi:hypothetical protein
MLMAARVAVEHGEKVGETIRKLVTGARVAAEPGGVAEIRDGEFFPEATARVFVLREVAGGYPLAAVAVVERNSAEEFDVTARLFLQPGDENRPEADIRRQLQTRLVGMAVGHPDGEPESDLYAWRSVRGAETSVLMAEDAGVILDLLQSGRPFDVGGKKRFPALFGVAPSRTPDEMAAESVGDVALLAQIIASIELDKRRMFASKAKGEAADGRG